jgi:mono/diheme cytochrome c family protein
VHERFVLGVATPAGAPISGTHAHGGRQADAASTPVQVDMTAGLPNGLKGDLKRGGAFYLANCATCHGQRGDGAGPRAYFINPKPRNFNDAASRARFNRLALYAAVSEGRNGSEMPAWNKVATPQQMADVSEYVFRSFIQGAAVSAAAAGR